MSQASMLRRRMVIVGVMLSAIALLATLTYQRNLVWADSLSLWRDAADKSPRSYRVQNNLGNSYLIQRDYQRALVHYRRAIALRAPFVEVYYNLGLVLEQLGRPSEAIPYYEEFVRRAGKGFEAHAQAVRFKLLRLRAGAAAPGREPGPHR